MAAPAPEVDAEKLAAEWVELKKEIADREKRLEEVIANLRAYVEETGEQTIGELMAYAKANPAKIVDAQGKTDAKIVKALMVMLDGTEYVKKSLDVTALKNNFEEKKVQFALREAGAQILVEEVVQFKCNP